MKTKSTDYRSDLKRVRGMGAAHEGVGHFWWQRMTALALIPLSMWLMTKLVTFLSMADRASAAHWFASPVSAILMAIFIVALFLHAKLGVQTIIEDYVHKEGAKLALLVFNSAALILLCLASLFAIARLHFIGI